MKNEFNWKFNWKCYSSIIIAEIIGFLIIERIRNMTNGGIFSFFVLCLFTALGFIGAAWFLEEN